MASDPSSSSSIMLANGFRAVPVTIPSSKLFKNTTEVTHWIYVRKHVTSSSSSITNNAASSSKNVAKEELMPAERTLFMANLPVDTTESHIREIFTKVAVNISTVRFRRNAVIKEGEGGDEEDEREELGQGEQDDSSIVVVGDDDDDQDDEERDALPSAMVAQGGNGGKNRKGGKKSGQQVKKSRVPKIIPLPNLDPREAMGSQGFLSTSSSAHVIFLDTNSLDRALELLFKKGGIRWLDPFKALRKEVKKQQQQTTLLLDNNTITTNNKPIQTTNNSAASFLLNHGAGIPPSGLEYLVEQYTLCRPSLSSIQSWANSKICLYQYRKAHPLPRQIGVRGVTVGASGELLDSDGFIIVQRSSGTGGSKYGRVGASAELGGSVGIAKIGFVENKNKKSQGLQDFYRFQFREKKREQLADLRAKFEADKAKVAQFKAGRRFKPY
ncbi:related to RRP7 - essential protein involved in rRNA processing and ribosome biogenesis [Melanopsichium pennsylvanicum]|uniref:Related to RRP7 - essential protein involved in rRNA processing and ribosome biogenesis n=2 Tax=Melanopsichium pennsylvanicum TaxID=63383 RepID=A0AAJ4XKM4_9BASI|nr:conserved hypothetical protein [Melanopsichium pennsylvanicum 4]SNX84275.1 related to RRP7 - essential protein involved in rRNA processing and ribosome biogenesis [Melanopsichium pennsylvanicum]